MWCPSAGRTVIQVSCVSEVAKPERRRPSKLQTELSAQTNSRDETMTSWLHFTARPEVNLAQSWTQRLCVSKMSIGTSLVEKQKEKQTRSMYNKHNIVFCCKDGEAYYILIAL